jgi:hypothetical protein
MLQVRRSDEGLGIPVRTPHRPKNRTLTRTKRDAIKPRLQNERPAVHLAVSARKRGPRS